ncbi:LCP family protein, partial [Streptomyces sp. NPDC003002]
MDSNINASYVDDKLGGGRPVSLSPGATNILLVGSDSRGDVKGKYGKVLSTVRSDTLMVLHISATRKWAAVVSLPRDSWVRIPACDRGDGTRSIPRHFKINSAYSIGGADGNVGGAAACTIKTVEHNTGLRIDHFVIIDFHGFEDVVNAVGGIEICPKHAIHDNKAHLDLEAGCQVVRGERALGYVRTRYSVGDGSDIGRLGRQQEFMRALAAKAQTKLTSPSDIYGFLDAATKSITTDKALAGIRPLYSLLSTLQDIPKERLTFLTVPHYPREVDIATDKANISWQYPQARTLFTSLVNDQEITEEQLATDTPITAGSIKVVVLNGSGTPGKAAMVAAELRAAGYSVAATGTIPQKVPRTTVTHPPGLEAHAEAFVARLRTATGTRSDADAAPTVVTLTVGADYTGL